MLRELHGVDALEMARVPQLGLEVVQVHPVHVGLVRAHENVRVVGGFCERGDSTHEWLLRNRPHAQIAAAKFHQEPRSGSADDVSVVEHEAGCDSLWEVLFVPRSPLEQTSCQRDLKQITGLRAAVRELIVGINHQVGRLPLQLAQCAWCWADLFVFEVDSPAGDVVVTGRDQFHRVVVHKLHAVCAVVPCRSPAHSRTIRHVPDDEGVVILPSEGAEVGLVAGEAEGFHLHLVEVEAVALLSLVEVPHDDVSRETHKRTLT
mmetsp:Transcript_19688/g.49433  ORF Transcript_19688/g.49433 Transcript_19688/m.49433 type:complete len:262 (-) Transcript_19688:353-1138(-)